MPNKDATFEFGKQVLEELRDLSIAPIPDCYEVWFTHLKNQNPQMSREIDERISIDRNVDSPFLSSLNQKYCRTSPWDPIFAEYFEAIIGEVEGVQNTAKNIKASTRTFGTDIEAISANALDQNISPTEIKTLVGKLIETAASATKRNEDLETQLNAAIDKIGSLHDSIKEIEHDANTDYLTKIANRRKLEGFLCDEIKPEHRDGAPLSMVVCDVDHFKKFNDTWGHQIGDHVLKFVATLLSQNTKGKDLVARYGGEEFAIALPDTPLNSAAQLAEQIREKIARKKLVSKSTNEDLGSITMSFGVAEYFDGMTSEMLFEDADAALYEAKRAGRNRVVTVKKAPALRKTG